MPTQKGMFRQVRIPVLLTFLLTVASVTGIALGGLARPSQPQGLSATPAPGQISLSWQPPAFNGGTPIQGYNISRGTSSGGEVHLAAMGNQTSFIDVSVSPGTTYYYTITAFNFVGESPPSNEASATTPSVPTAPRSLTASGGIGQVSLGWMAPISNGGSPITGYVIYRGTTSGGESFLTSVSAVTSFTDTQVTAGTRYYYKVAAINAVGIGGQSNEANATPTSAPSQPVLGFVETNAWWFILIASFGGLIVGWALGRPKAMAWYSRAPPPCGVSCNCTGAQCRHGRAGHCAAPGCGPTGGHTHCGNVNCQAFAACSGTCTLPAGHAGLHACSHGHSF